MSRIGKLPVAIPAGVSVKLGEGNTLTVKGPKGELTRSFNMEMNIKEENGTIVVTRPSDNKEHRALHGLTRTLINNMVVGVSEGFSKTLDMVGTGYRASVKGQELVIEIGYSHPVIFKMENGITYEELQKERLMGTEYGIPRFAEVLKLVDGKVPLLVELKGENAEDALCWRVAPLLDAYGGEYSVESFNPLLLRWFSKHRPDVARGQLVTNLLREKQEGSKILNFALTHMLLNFLSRPDFIACDGRYQRDLAFWICKKIFRVPFFMWTVRKQELLDYNRRTGRFSIFEGFLPK